MTEFLDKVALAAMEMKHSTLPIVETSKKIIEHYNRNQMTGFYDAGYFIFQNVRVCEEGTRKKLEKADGTTLEQLLHKS